MAKAAPFSFVLYVLKTGALVFFRDGKYLGAVDGLRLWADLVREADEIMHSEPHYPPSVGIPVRSI